MEANHRARMEEMFKRTDVDGDGKLSPEELKKGRESMRDKFRERFKDKENKGFARPEPRGEAPQPDGSPDSPQ
jgi:Ca2+-binding EF-hand superfamily protein